MDSNLKNFKILEVCVFNSPKRCKTKWIMTKSNSTPVIDHIEELDIDLGNVQRYWLYYVSSYKQYMRGVCVTIYI